MARIYRIDTAQEDIQNILGRGFQSGNINLLIGSGASCPAIPAAGEIEAQIQEHLEQGQQAEANKKLYELIATLQGPTNDLIDGAPDAVSQGVLDQYQAFTGIVETVLNERRTRLLPKRANLFTPNYDLFIEKGCEHYQALTLNDGFSRVPSLTNRMRFSSQNFSNYSVFNVENLYEQPIEIPCINLIKIHGSLSWRKAGDDVLFSVRKKELLADGADDDAIAAYIKRYAIILPGQSKFRETVMDRIYYDLLRIYANELDKAGTLLISFGFSFADQHILDITMRALKNPTLKLEIFAHNDDDVAACTDKFDAYNNVNIIAPEDGGTIDFEKFNAALRAALPKMLEHR